MAGHYLFNYHNDNVFSKTYNHNWLKEYFFLWLELFYFLWKKRVFSQELGFIWKRTLFYAILLIQFISSTLNLYIFIFHSYLQICLKWLKLSFWLIRFFFNVVVSHFIFNKWLSCFVIFTQERIRLLHFQSLIHNLLPPITQNNVFNNYHFPFMDGSILTFNVSSKMTSSPQFVFTCITNHFLTNKFAPFGNTTNFYRLYLISLLSPPLICSEISLTKMCWGFIFFSCFCLWLGHHKFFMLLLLEDLVTDIPETIRCYLCHNFSYVCQCS